MMSESGTEDHANGETFEIIDSTSTASALPAPSALPDFASLGISPPQQQNVPNQPPSFAQTGETVGADAMPPPPVVPPAPSHFPPPPAISSPPKTQNSESLANPYSIRAGASASHSIAPRPPPPVSHVFQPAPVLTEEPPANAASAINQQGPGQQQQYSVGLDMSSMQPLTGSPLSVAESDLGYGERSGVWGWIQGTVAGSHLLTKVAETAKSSVDSVITTLDPQMKDYMASAGSIELAIASDKEIKINAVKEGFQRVYSQVIARGLGSPGSQTMAAQPRGFESGRKGAEERIISLRNSGLVPRDVPIVAVEGFVFETSNDRMFGCDSILLDDPSRNIQWEAHSQSIQLPPSAVQLLKAHTPSDYPLKESGFAVTVGQAVAEATGSTPYDWQENLCGISRRYSIACAVSAIAFQYSRIILSNVSPQ